MKLKTKHPFPAAGRAPAAPSLKNTTPLRMPTHDEISSHARAIWEKSGRPADRDTAIWLEAERGLRLGVVPGTGDAAYSDTQEMLGEPNRTIEDRLKDFGDQTGDRSATSL
jgi:hypothetical protein